MLRLYRTHCNKYNQLTADPTKTANKIPQGVTTLSYCIDIRLSGLTT